MSALLPSVKNLSISGKNNGLGPYHVHVNKRFLLSFAVSIVGETVNKRVLGGNVGDGGDKGGQGHGWHWLQNPPIRNAQGLMRGTNEGASINSFIALTFISH